MAFAPSGPDEALHLVVTVGVRGAAPAADRQVARSSVSITPGTKAAYWSFQRLLEHVLNGSSRPEGAHPTAPVDASGTTGPDDPLHERAPIELSSDVLTVCRAQSLAHIDFWFPPSTAAAVHD
jgi:hypothetical protein